MDQAVTRDARLDFFRGLAMFIIFVAHLPANPWNDWIPARFGPSDATEMFVFCSGFASALAFGTSFRRHGFAVGTLRIAHRCWQVYWAHIGLFLMIATLTVAGSEILDRDYVGFLYLQRFFAEPEQGLIHLATLRYVPNYFDILPMYLVVLAMVPMVMALAALRPAIAFAACLALYAAAYAFDLHLPAEWWSERPWFFNPLCWQLLFFTGFAFASGWLPEPRYTRRGRWLAILFVLALVPLNWEPIWSSSAWLDRFSLQFVPFKDKTDFGPLRYLHLLALAYLGLAIVNPHRDSLSDRLTAPIVLVGQQALPVFLWSMTLALVLGMALDTLGRTALTVTAANLGGFASLIGVAALARLIKTQPWRRSPTSGKQAVGPTGGPDQPALGAGLASRA